MFDSLFEITFGKCGRCFPNRFQKELDLHASACALGALSPVRVRRLKPLRLITAAQLWRGRPFRPSGLLATSAREGKLFDALSCGHPTHGFDHSTRLKKKSLSTQAVEGF